MSGFCGWLSREGSPESAPALLAKMAAALPSPSTVQPADALHPTAGLALRAAAEESAWHEDGDLHAAIIGYPRWSDPDLASLARAQGQAAALREAYRRYDTALLEHLSGHFAFVLLEPRRGRAFCAVDRFGVYRLCLATPRAGHFAFSTSADSLRAYPGVGATISPQTLYQYLAFIDRVAAPGNIYEEQSKLCPGEALVFDDDGLRRWRYWQLDYRRTSRASEAELHQALRERLEEAVARCTEGERDDKTASFLSGGLDSSSVAGFLAKVNDGKGRCVTISFQHAEFDETRYAEEAARHFGMKHETFMVGPQEVLDALPKLCAAFDEPYSNSSAIPCYYCAKVSKEAGDEVILAGDGGDELFGGNTRYLKDDVFDHYRLLPDVVRRVLLEPAFAHLPWCSKIPLLRRLSNYVDLAKRSVAHRMTSHNAFASTPAERIFSAEAFAAIDPEGPRRFVEAIYDDAAGDEKIQRMMHLDLQLTLADSDLRKVMTSCTAADIRVRFPMLDDDLAEFSGTLPAELLTEGGEIRQFYKAALKGFLPQTIIDKSKMGFGLPMFQYISELPALAEFFCDALSDLKQRTFFDSGFLDLLIDDVRQGNSGTNAGIVWDLAVLEIWMASRGISRTGKVHGAAPVPTFGALDGLQQGQQNR
jgi:asparagine synthase (glutamine-hydrolysing)